MSGFGAGFRKAREALGVSIDVVANETRIGARFLRAIENEDFDVLPGGLFNRGFIRTYAHRLGMDADQAVEDYQRLIENREEHEPEPEFYRPARESGPNWALIVGVAALVVAALAYVIFLRNDEPTVKPAPQNRSLVEPPAISPPAPIQNPPVAPQPETTPPIAAAAKTNPPAVEAPAPSKPPLDVEMRVSETSWVQVFTDGATTATDMGEFPPGTTRRYSAQKSIELRIGNAGGLSLKVNDREISSLGKSGEVRYLTITPENASRIGTPGN